MADAVETGASTSVGVPSAEYTEMLKGWKLPDALLGGTRTMRDSEWLPKNPGETAKQWTSRRDRTVLFNAYSDAIRNALARPFSREVSIDFGDAKKTPEQLDRFMTITDAEGSNLTTFERRVMHEAIHRGLVHVLVDMPSDLPGTLAAERASRFGPYQVMISAKDLIGWNEGMDDANNKFLSEIRFIERRQEQDPTDPHKQAEVEFIRVIRDNGEWELWRPVEMAGTATAWALVDTDVLDFKDGIPLDTIYTNRTGFMTGRPAFEDLAWVNLQHFQRDSGLNNILSVLDCPVLFKAGFPDALPGDDGPTVIGPNHETQTENENAKMMYVEHSGSAVGKSMEQIAKLEDRMERYGLRPLQMRVQSATATGQAISENRASSDVQEWAINQKQSLRRRLHMAAAWVGTEIDDDEVEVNLFTDFDAISASASSTFDHIQRARDGRDMTRKTYLVEMKRRGITGPGMDPEVEDEEAQTEADAAVAQSLEMAAASTVPGEAPDEE